MKAVVTGGCGFLGSHACERFRADGWEVVSVDNLTKAELARTGYQTDAARDHNRAWLEKLGVQLIDTDVCDAEQLLDVTAGCDYIVHTAAQPAVTISLEEPLRDLQTNVVGGVNVLEAARRHRVPVASCATIHVYGNWINDELTETDSRYERQPPAVAEDARTMSGYLTPLHASKASAEHYLLAYVSAYGVRAASFRLTGIYGTRQLGGEDHGWVANFAIRNVLGWPVTIFGTGKQVRDIIYASDVADAFLAFYRRGDAGIYNIGGGERTAISLIECINLIDRLTGRTTEVRYEDARFGDLKYFVCDVSKATSALEWQPSVLPEAGVAKLIDWIESERHLFSATETAQ